MTQITIQVTQNLYYFNYSYARIKKKRSDPPNTGSGGQNHADYKPFEKKNKKKNKRLQKAYWQPPEIACIKIP